MKVSQPTNATKPRTCCYYFLVGFRLCKEEHDCVNPRRWHAEQCSTGMSQEWGGAILPLGHLCFRCDNAVRDRVYSAAARKLVHCKCYKEGRCETGLYVMACFTADS